MGVEGHPRSHPCPAPALTRCPHPGSPAHLLQCSCRSPNSSAVSCGFQFTSSRRLLSSTSRSLRGCSEVGAEAGGKPQVLWLTLLLYRVLCDDSVEVHPSAPTYMSEVLGSTNSSVLRSVCRKVTLGLGSGSSICCEDDVSSAGDWRPEWPLSLQT